MSNKWTWETAHLSPGAGVVVVKKIDGEWHTFAMWARGGYDIPILYVADNENGMIINRFGQDGLFTKYADRIEGLYNKKNIANT